uniref:Uncharacterized protein n=1 Tax=Cannabis sativa TaxID=3483 RepID=A0A803P1P6_CANSA
MIQIDLKSHNNPSKPSMQNKCHLSTRGYSHQLSHVILATNPNVQAPIDSRIDNPNARLPPLGNPSMRTRTGGSVPAGTNTRTTRITTPLIEIKLSVQEVGITDTPYTGETGSGTSQPSKREP